MRTVWAWAVMWGSVALAAPTTLTVASGDCRNPELIDAAKSFASGVAAPAISSEAVLERFRPLPILTTEDLARLLDSAQAQFYAGTYDKALESTAQALAGTARLSPRAEPWKLTQRALMLQSMIYKSAGKKNESNEAQKRILRIEPQAKLDADYYTPATVQAFDALKKDVARAKRVKLSIVSTPSGAQVFLEGARVGTTPFAGEFPTGDYRLTLASGDRLSFLRVLSLNRAEAIAVDLAFEGSIAPQPPVCVWDEPAQALDHALRLATLAGADTVAVLRLEARNNEPGWVTATLLETARGTRVREGGVRFMGAKRERAVRDLAGFVHTGHPSASVVPTIRENAAPAPVPAVAEAAMPDGVSAEPAGPPPAAAGVTRSGRGWSPRIASFVLMGAGAIAAGVGAGLYGVGGADRAALLALIDDQGRVRPGASIEDAKRVQTRIDASNTTALAIGVGGGVGLMVGVALFFLVPPSESFALVPARDGLYAAFAF